MRPHLEFLDYRLQSSKKKAARQWANIKKGCHLKSCHGSHYKGIQLQSSGHLNLKRLTLPSAGNDMQQGEISCTAGRTINETPTWEEFGIIYQSRHTL